MFPIHFPEIKWQLITLIYNATNNDKTIQTNYVVVCLLIVLVKSLPFIKIVMLGRGGFKLWHCEQAYDRSVLMQGNITKTLYKSVCLG